MRISDWSSDVCSADLADGRCRDHRHHPGARARAGHPRDRSADPAAGAPRRHGAARVPRPERGPDAEWAVIAPRLEVDLDKVAHNAGVLVNRLATSGIRVTGVTKATLGSPDVAAAMVRGGVDRKSTRLNSSH